MRLVTLPLEPPILPQLARPRKGLPDEGDGWAYEPKWDGFRTLVFLDGDEVYLQSRGGKPMARYFPEITFPTGLRAVLDGELVIDAPDGAGETFDTLSQRIHPAASRVAMLAETTPARFVAFDLLADEDETLLDLPYAERRERLEAWVSKHDPASGGHPFALTPMVATAADADRWLHEAEGVIAKQTAAPYLPGKRDGMVKVKRMRTLDAVAAGWRPGKVAGTVGSIMLGVYDEDGKLRVVGHSSGFSAKEKRELVETLGRTRPASAAGRSVALEARRGARVDLAASRTRRRGQVRPRLRRADPSRHEGPALARRQGAAGVPRRSTRRLTRVQPVDPWDRPVLVAPDSFKGTFSSAVVAAAIGRGLERAGVAPLPICARWRTAARGRCRCSSQPSAARRPAPASATRWAARSSSSFALVEGGGQRSSRSPPRAGSAHVSRRRARPRSGVVRVLGGTGDLVRPRSTPAPRSCWSPRVAARRPTAVPARSRAIEEHGGLRGAVLVVLCDVRIPFERAAAVFGPQKGADAATVERLATRLAAFAERCPRDPRGVPGGGRRGRAGGRAPRGVRARLEPGAGVRARGARRRRAHAGGPGGDRRRGPAGPHHPGGQGRRRAAPFARGRRACRPTRWSARRRSSRSMCGSSTCRRSRRQAPSRRSRRRASGSRRTCRRGSGMRAEQREQPPATRRVPSRPPRV